jgi:hypothetical protein
LGRILNYPSGNLLEKENSLGKTSARTVGNRKRLHLESYRYAKLLYPFRNASPPSPSEALVTPCRYEDMPCGIHISNLLTDVKVTLASISILYQALRINFVALRIFIFNAANCTK